MSIKQLIVASSLPKPSKSRKVFILLYYRIHENFGYYTATERESLIKYEERQRIIEIQKRAAAMTVDVGKEPVKAVSECFVKFQIRIICL